MSHSTESEIKNVTLSSKSDRVKKDKKKHKKDVVCEQEPESEHEESETEEESEEEDTETQTESESEAETESEDDKVSFSTTDILQNDPLYFVLSKIFITDDNVNIANVLQEINKKLDLIIRRNK